MGDAGVFADPDDPAQGLMFDGRTAENFKLTSGTWVHVGELRVAIIAACAPLLQDTVIAGHDRDSLGALLFLNPAACVAACPDLADKGVALAVLTMRPEIVGAIKEALARHNAANPASSRRIARAVFLVAPPSIDGGEITDKGYINQRAVLDNRADDVAALFADEPDSHVLILD